MEQADCLFCRIVAQKNPAGVVLETPTTLALRDINPQAPVHVLVIPKEHIGSISALEPRHAELVSQIHETIKAVARSEKVESNGYRVVVNNGRDADQTVRHLHYHVLGGRRMSWPPG